MGFVGQSRWRRAATVAGVALCFGLTLATLAHSSDHGDGKVAATRPETDIADVFSWMSPDTQRANLVMTIYPSAPATARFGADIQYVFHTARHSEYGIAPSDRLNAMCTFDNAPKQNVSCWLGSEYVKGDASAPAGIASPSGKLRVFAGLRDDPAFFNRGAFLAQRTYINTAVNTQPFDVSGCQINTGANGFAAAPADAFLGKNVLAIVLSVDKTLLVDAASPVLSVSASTRSSP